MGLGFAWKLGLHPSTFAGLGTILSGFLPNWIVVGPMLAMGSTWTSILLKHFIYMYCGQLGMHGLRFCLETRLASIDLGWFVYYS